MITFKKHVFQVEGKRKKKLVTGAEDDSSTDLNEDEIQATAVLRKDLEQNQNEATARALEESREQHSHP